jgi:hypothetical protein
MILDDNHVLRRQYHVIIHQFGVSREPKTTTQLHSGPWTFNWIWSRTSHTGFMDLERYALPT